MLFIKEKKFCHRDKSRIIISVFYYANSQTSSLKLVGSVRFYRGLHLLADLYQGVKIARGFEPGVHILRWRVQIR